MKAHLVRWLCRAAVRNKGLIVRSMCTQPLECPTQPVTSSAYFWAPTNKPDEFSLDQEGLWYSLPYDYLPTVYNFTSFFPTYYRRQVETFSECSFIIRKPLVDLVECMKRVHPDLPIKRFVLYGKRGTGKSLTLCQIAHHAHSHSWIVCHVSNAATWNISTRREIAMSTWVPGRIDMPLEAAEWLKNFRLLNAALIEKYDLRTSKEYKWSARETTSPNESLLTLVDVGINRIRFASDCVGVLLKELKHHASNRRAKVMVTIDIANAMFFRTVIKREDRSFAPPDSLTLNLAFRKMLHSDWNNGMVVLVADEKIKGKVNFPSHLPYHVFGPAGFDHLDPFVPVPVENFSDKEANSFLDYYFDKNWIQHPEGQTSEGRKQLIHLGARNPFAIERLCAVW